MSKNSKWVKIKKKSAKYSEKIEKENCEKSR